MQWVIVFKDYVPLVQTLLWVSLIFFAVLIFYQPLCELLRRFSERMHEGGAVEVGIGSASIKLPEFVHDLKKVEPEPTDKRLTDVEERKSIPSWTKIRKEIIDRNREVFLAHLSKPSKNQERNGKKWFDVYIFLARHHEVANAEIDYAEFFLGKSWGDQIYRVENKGGDIKSIGISTSAYGTTLAICRVVFKDGYEAVIDRYIDFEMCTITEKGSPSI